MADLFKAAAAAAQPAALTFTLAIGTEGVDWVAGDEAVVFIVTNTNHTVDSMTAGWTQLATVAPTGGDCRIRAWSKTLVAGDTAPVVDFELASQEKGISGYLILGPCTLRNAATTSSSVGGQLGLSVTVVPTSGDTCVYLIGADLEVAGPAFSNWSSPLTERIDAEAQDITNVGVATGEFLAGGSQAMTVDCAEADDFGMIGLVYTPAAVAAASLVLPRRLLVDIGSLLNF